jgi:hypothetical protein
MLLRSFQLARESTEIQKKQCFCVSMAIFFLKLRHCFNPVIAGKDIAIGWTPGYAHYLMTVI